MTVARVPSFTRLATTVSMPDVPVPDTAKANDPSAARNTPRQTRAHIVEQRHHQRIEMADGRRRHRAHHARRGQARSGAEQDAIGVGQQAHAGISSKCASASRSAGTIDSGSGSSGGRGTPTS